MTDGDLLYLELAKDPNGFDEPLLDWWQEFEPERYRFVCLQRELKALPKGWQKAGLVTKIRAMLDRYGMLWLGYEISAELMQIDWSEYPRLSVSVPKLVDLLNPKPTNLLKALVSQHPITHTIPLDRRPVDLGTPTYPKYAWISQSQSNNWHGDAMAIVPDKLDLHPRSLREYQPYWDTANLAIEVLGKRIAEYGRKA